MRQITEIEKKAAIDILVNILFKNHESNLEQEDWALIVSEKRTEKLDELTIAEKEWLVEILLNHEIRVEKKDEIEAIAFEIGMVHPKLPHLIDLIKIDKLIAEKGISNNGFYYLSFDELVEVKKLFMTLRRKHNKSQMVKASNATKSLLKELNIKTA